jgi:hypothetical protein
MHLVANMVEIPMEKVEEALCQRAVPGFTGSVTVHLRILPTAANEVEFRFESEALLQIAKASDPETPHVTNARVASVRRALAENAGLFQMGTKLKALRCHFVQGELRKMSAVEVE